MSKPVQTKITDSNDPYELSAALADAMTSIECAMESMRGFAEFADWFDALSDIYDEMQPDCETYDMQVAADYAQEIDALRRDYYRSVL